MKETENKKTLIPPLFIAGVLLVFIPIFTYLTLERIKRQDEFFSQKMFERGMALIRTFEAGTRTGMFTMRWGAGRIQTMLQETATLPDIKYVVIVTPEGEILAHSNPAEVGGQLESMPPLDPVDTEPYSGYHRVIKNQGKHGIFEVYKRFVPFGGHPDQPMRKMRGRMMRMMRDQNEDRPDPRDWSRIYQKTFEPEAIEKARHYIIAGLSMKKHLGKRKEKIREAVFRSLILFLFACTGIIALFALQAWRQTKASLSQVKALSDNVIQNMPTGLVTLDPDYRVTSVNDSARTIMGQAVDTPPAEWIDLAKQITPENPVAMDEMSLTKDDGQKIRMEVMASRITKQGDAGFLILLKDLTQLRELQTQVETHKRLAAIGKLAGGVAHEIRNPLSSIKGFATYFAKQYEDKETDRETAQIMINEVERINRSITQLLEFSKPLAVEKKPVDIEQMIYHSIKLIQPDLEQKQIKTAVDNQSRHRTISTDPDRMNQVFLNLYINAIDALDEGGELAVTVKDQPDDTHIEIQISDSGCGMDDTTLEKIFDPYFTTRASGTGLGLSIVHNIIDNLGGHIRVESKIEKGTVFTIRLPLNDDNG